MSYTLLLLVVSVALLVRLLFLAHRCRKAEAYARHADLERTALQLRVDQLEEEQGFIKFR
ncbi:hypothetical protein [Pontibacter virosus]|uniref:hypothetical protein n=1 Tax=Pontibacter virosus TaxID=1765052 RepID=UPI000E300FF1|nr:hypothetical protein [Pontibacter virosus]